MPRIHGSDNTKKVVNPKTSRKNSRNKEVAEIERITKSIRTIPAHSTRFLLFRPNRRQKLLQKQQQQQQQITPQQNAIFNAQTFTELPLSTRTLDGLAALAFTEMTPIQRLSLPQSLAGRDILAAAPTGSGKTLSFLIPVLETLWREQWTNMDGLGALILSPTRELSMQIFDVLRKVARSHPISAGLVIGGKDFQGERDKVGNMNVLVGTPGRVLHHMDTVAEMECGSLKVLVLDEADRILDMGFKGTIDAILKNLPEERQTLLFSATQTKDIKALARLSLKSPEYLSVNSAPSNVSNGEKTGRDGDKKKKEENEDGNDGGEKDEEDEEDEDSDEDDGEDDGETKQDASTGGFVSDVKICGVPAGLSQSYSVVKLQEKLSVLWSFIKSHLKAKMIIFFTSGKQVRFAFESFCKLRPGMSLLHIHGNMKQAKRTEMYEAFCRTKSAALFATDIASRGLDFPDVEWVVQADCPDDVATYVHRVGRTARFKKQGRAMLLLNEGFEERFIKRLNDKGLNLQKREINSKRMANIESRVAGLVTGSMELRNLAQRSFVFYVKAVWQKGDKDVFDVQALDIDGLAKSFGLSVTPNVKFKGGSKGGGSGDGRAKLKTKTIFGYDKRYTRNVKVEKEDKEEEELLEKENKYEREEGGEIGKKRGREKTELKRDVEVDVDDSNSDIEEGDDGDDGDDDILKVKRSYAPGEKIVHGDGDSDEDEEEKIRRMQTEAQRRKRKKRKLDLFKGMGSSNRVVFDDDGNAVHASEIDVVNKDDLVTEGQHDGIEDYAKSVQERLKESEQGDKLREKERVKTLHAKKRAKRRENNRIIGGGGANEGEVSVVVSGGDDVDGEDKDGDEEDGSVSEGDDVEEQEKLALQILQSRTR